MREHTDYLKLMMAIAGGVLFGGILLSIARVFLSIGLVSAVVSNLDFSFNEQPASAVTRSAQYKHARAQQREQTSRAAKTQRVKAIQRRRAQSDQGRLLWATCEDWSRNYKRTPTETVRINGTFYCNRYNRFVETGHAGNAHAPVLETR